MQATVRVLALLLLSTHAVAADEVFPEFDDATLKQGRTIWLGTCKACHATGLADAPMVFDAEAWAPRLLKDRNTLYQHALNGFFGPMGTQMPPRGGNDALNDDEVRAAVDYMAAIAGKIKLEN